MFTEEQVKNGEYDRWRAKEYIDRIDEAMLKDGITIKDLPKEILDRYKDSARIARGGRA